MDQATIQEFIKQGILGVIIVLIVTGWLHPKPTVTNLVNQLAGKDSLIEKQAKLLTDKDTVIADKDRIIAMHAATIERLALGKRKGSVEPGHEGHDHE